LINSVPGAAVASMIRVAITRNTKHGERNSA
jgi:hypothetical protein